MEPQVIEHNLKTNLKVLCMAQLALPSHICGKDTRSACGVIFLKISATALSVPLLYEARSPYSALGPEVRCAGFHKATPV